jgi:hypothetical protein
MSRFLIVAGACYVAFIAVLLAGLIVARNAAHQSFSDSAAQQAWDDWRKSTQSEAGESPPVQRSVPKSVEPPTLVLLRDHFAVCAAAAICISTALYWTIAVLLRGVLYGPSFPVEYKHNPKDQ